MFGRIIGFFFVALAMAAVAGGVIVMIVRRIALAELLPLLVLLAIVIFVFGMVARRFRRTFVPVQDLVRSAGRLADGDYSARVDARSSRTMGPVASSFNAMAERLEHADAERRRLMADLSHELRNPLAVVRGELEAIVDGVRPGDPAQIDSLLDEVATMERLIEDLGLLTESESGTLTLQRETVDVAGLVDDVAASYRPAAADSGVSIAVEATPRIAIDADPVRIRQALSNLVVNALNAMPDGGRITIHIDQRDDTVRVEVTDTGIGIDAERLASVFERFVKSDDSPGRGLGLPIARGLVRAHGGDLDIERSSPAGTTVVMTLPIT